MNFFLQHISRNWVGGNWVVAPTCDSTEGRAPLFAPSRVGIDFRSINQFFKDNTAFCPKGWIQSECILQFARKEKSFNNNLVKFWYKLDIIKFKFKWLCLIKKLCTKDMIKFKLNWTVSKTNKENLLLLENV